MSLRDDLAGVLARDPRYTFQAYVFLFEALEHAKTLRRRAGVRARSRARGRAAEGAGHVSGAELCHAARDLALRQYGLMARTVLNQWGLFATSDLGNIVYHLIASGDLKKSPTDARADFDNVYDFETAFQREYVMPLDEVA